MATFNTRHPLVIVGYVAWFAALGLAALMWWTRPFSDAAGYRKVPSNTDRGPDAFSQEAKASDQAYDAIALRPLFSASRRPVPPLENDGAPAAEAEPSRAYVLKGSILLTNDSVAFLVDRRTEDLIGVREGTVVRGWVVTDIGASWLRLRRDNRYSTLRIPNLSL